MIDPSRTPERVAAIQMCATTDVASNVDTTCHLVTRAADAGAASIFVPEAFAFIGPDREKRPMLEAVGPDADGPILNRCRRLADDLGCHLILGGFHELGSANPDKSHNTCVHIGPDGAVVATYRKIHLFDVDLPDGTQLRESARTDPGTELVTTDLPWGRLGLTICYDVRFPALYQRLVARGAIALTVPSAFTATTGAAHWHALLRARAIECQSYVIAPAQHGSHGGKRRSYGHSVIIDPWGTVIAELGEGHGDGFIVADIDADEVARVRRVLPSLANQAPLPDA